jgi:hypothetical protein
MLISLLYDHVYFADRLLWLRLHQGWHIGMYLAHARVVPRSLSKAESMGMDMDGGTFLESSPELAPRLRSSMLLQS